MAIAELGAQIRQARLQRGLTQTQLAQEVGVTKKTISIWEGSGVVSPLRLTRLAEFLDLDVAGHWTERIQTTPANGHYRTLTMEAPLPSLTASEHPLDTLRRVRRELIRMTAELDSALQALEQ